MFEKMSEISSVPEGTGEVTEESEGSNELNRESPTHLASGQIAVIP